MVSDSTIFIIGLCVSVLCVAFVVASVVGLRESGRDRPVGRRDSMFPAASPATPAPMTST